MDDKLKLTKYETFLNERLRFDLEKVNDERERVCSERAEYLQLCSALEKIQQNELPVKDLKTMVDLGSHFYAHARIPDASRVMVAVGLEFYLELTLPEAVEFVNKKVGFLNDRVKELTDQAAYISAKIKLVMEALKEIQFLDGNSRKVHEVVW